MNRALQLIGIVALAVSFSGCSTIRSYTMPDEENLLSGAGSLMTNTGKAEKFEQLTLPDLLKAYGLEGAAALTADDDLKKDIYKYRRNELQDRIIASSNQRCGTYVRTLIASKSQTQMGWGGLGTLLSGAASVIPHAATAKALAAGSTVSTGYVSLYNEAYFHNLAVSVIVSGIDKRREGILQQITEQREENLIGYPVNRAVADALTYHSACNVVTGLETAASATKESDASKAAAKLK